MPLEFLLYVLLVLVGAGLLFLRNFFSELAKQTAEIATLAARTKIIEESHVRVAQQIEPIKSALSRKNIAFQIRHTEFARLLFERFDQLYGRLYDLQKYSAANLFTYADDRDFKDKKDEFLKRYWQTEDAYYLCVLYLDDRTAQSALSLLKECFKAYSAVVDFYYSDQGRKVFQSLPPSQSLHDKSIESLDKFNESMTKFPLLLQELRFKVQEALDDDNVG
ncbi:hypothetical protein D4R75_08220 [bacterium]|nr:MAG: hypothetical protein D4R75_08220 [bacterium]